MLGVALHEAPATPEAARRLREERLGEIQAEGSPGRELCQEVSGAAPDFQHPITRPWGEQGEDTTDALVLDVPDEVARMVVELLEVILRDHRIVPRLELATVLKRAPRHCRAARRGSV
jgi:hypothetical protein